MCSLRNACLLRARGDVCDDGDDGTYDDRIRNGVCAGLPIPDCDDGDPNTIDTFEGGVCVHTPINPPSPEACNALDDDQDGLIDEGLGYDVPNGVVVCAGGVETVVCNSGFADTGGAPSTGCEVNVMTDPANCGALGNGVPTVPNATVACGWRADTDRLQPGLRRRRRQSAERL